MKKTLAWLLVAVVLAAPVAGAAEANPRVRLETTLGAVVVELYPDKAPKTVDNFLRYVRADFYDQTIFHRVIRGFMIQGGGLTATLQRKETSAPVPNEADNGLVNARGTLAMARTMDPHSATSQFFINVKDNPFLDHSGKTPKGWGYCVFGRVVEGMEVVDRIENVKTAASGGRRDVPVTPVVIRKAGVVPAPEAEGPQDGEKADEKDHR